MFHKVLFLQQHFFTHQSEININTSAQLSTYKINTKPVQQFVPIAPYYD
jgi:hypothetical protein